MTRTPTDKTIDPSALQETLDPNQKQTQDDHHKVLAKGEDVDGYVIIDQAATSGSQADCYTVTKNASKYVLKIYRNGILPNPISARLAKAAAAHHVAPLVGSGFSRGRYYEVYPLFGGGSLASLIESAPVSLSFVNRVILPCIDDALSFLESQNIVHADLKPENIFLNTDMSQAFLGDLGVATTFSNDRTTTSFRGNVSYSPRGVSPNQPTVFTKGYDYASLGLLIWRSMSADFPFERSSPEKRESLFINPRIPNDIPPQVQELIRLLIAEKNGCVAGHSICQNYLHSAESLANSRSSSGNLYCHPVEVGFDDGHLLEARDACDLISLVQTNWDVVGHFLNSDALLPFLSRFTDCDEFKARYISPFACNQIDIRLFAFWCGLVHTTEDGKSRRIAYKGLVYPSLIELLKVANDNRNNEAIDFIEKGLVVQYLRLFDYPRRVIDEATSISNPRYDVRTVAESLLGLFSQDKPKPIIVKGRTISDVSSLLEVISSCELSEIAAIIEDNRFRPWAFYHGLGDIVKEVDSLDV